MRINELKNKIDLNGKAILVTGSPGFIGANVVLRLLQETEQSLIISLDNLSEYYDTNLKMYRLHEIEQIAKTSKSSHLFIKGDVANMETTEFIFKTYHPTIAIHLAAQAGVRYSIDHPDEYIHSNIIGFYNILEATRKYPVMHLVYASSSSVYGGNTSIPFRTEDKTDNPVSLYAATKKSNELFAYCYSKLYGIPMTGLRFFTVYGPAGRPDMFYYSATNRLVKGESIKVFNHGNCERDFTYIDDIVEGIYRVSQQAPVSKQDKTDVIFPPHAVYNIGGGNPENVMDFLNVLTNALKEACVLPEQFMLLEHCEMVPMQPGDVPITYADSKALEDDFGFRPRIGIQEGLKRFALWYRDFYGYEANKKDVSKGASNYVARV